MAQRGRPRKTPEQQQVNDELFQQETKLNLSPSQKRILTEEMQKVFSEYNLNTLAIELIFEGKKICTLDVSMEKILKSKTLRIEVTESGTILLALIKNH